MYLVIKKNEKPVNCGSVKAVSQHTGIDINKLYYNLGRKKLDSFQYDGYIIMKTDVIRAK